MVVTLLVLLADYSSRLESRFVGAVAALYMHQYDCRKTSRRVARRIDPMRE